LYLSTEFSQAELLYKAQVLRLQDAAVLPWDDRGSARPGDVIAEHLARHVSGEVPLTSADRKSSAIKAVWELLHPDSPGPSTAPVRAVVIDAFPLADAEGDNPHMRSDLVAFVQSLERDGISTVLVEESAPGISGWLPFVVDLVFELEWRADPHTGTLRRQLRCPKSRYAQVLAGPHEVGLEDDVPAVWPDLLAITGRSGAGAGLVSSRPAAWFVPVPGGYARLNRGGITVVTEQAAHYLKGLQRTPGIESVDVRCGSVTTIHGPGADTAINLFDSGDFQDLAWTIVRLTRERGVNAAIFSGVEPMVRRPHLEAGLLHLLETLRALGLLVVVRTAPPIPYSLAQVADLDLSQSPIARALIAWPLPRLRSAALWMVSEPLGLQMGLSHEIHAGRVDRLHREAHQWLSVLIGQEASAASDVLLNLSAGGVHPRATLLWTALCAVHARSLVALKHLEEAATPTDRHLVLPFLFRAVAAQGRAAEMPEMARTFGSDIDSIILERLLAEGYLFAPDDATRAEGMNRLAALVERADAPSMHRADAAHNLGVASEEREARDTAIRWYLRALDLNPLLDASREAAQRLGAKVPPPPP
ncbi:MAG TPA: hypothetical protein VLS89_12360, partial [Candidatus Nanopelagicales bacterium]|nr:hypothetical protein [Candidatus Nanopelagicales bacterium]